jgi:hypothetical protein
MKPITKAVGPFKDRVFTVASKESGLEVMARIVAEIGGDGAICREMRYPPFL